MSADDVLAVRVPVATVWTGPDAPRDVDAPAVLDEPDVAGWAAAMDPATRRDLLGRTVTQLVMGEPVRVLDERAGWAQVAAPAQPSSAHRAGYPGWVRRSHLGAPADPAGVDPATGTGSATVVARLTPCALDTGAAVDLSFGSTLPVASVGTRTATLLLPDHRRGEVRLEHLRIDGSVRPAPGDVTGDALTMARGFLGVRYLWGGTSGWGVDCSGLVHLSYRALAVRVPRDAFDQAAAPGLETVPLDRVRPGDLYFFARPGGRVYHVGFVSRPADRGGPRWMLHAPEGGELVEDAPIAADRSRTLVSAGRVRAPTGEP